jgi:ADP-heptose:LPS heptosyltransferase
MLTDRVRVLNGIDRLLWPAAVAIAQVGSAVFRFRNRETRPLIVRPGGMGDLILLCVAVEELGYDPRSYLWAIEGRSSVWARHLGLDYFSYDAGIVKHHWKTAGRFATVINTEQLYGLAQATAMLARGRAATLTCFDSNRGSSVADRKVAYDPDRGHEAVEFQKLVAAAMGVDGFRPPPVPRRRRSEPACEMPIVGIAGLQSPSRALSEQQWADLIRPWIGGGSFRIASSKTDRAFALALARRFEGRADVFEGEFQELCRLIRRSSEVFTVDGGFLHIASYYGVPATAVFTSGRDSKWAPLAPGSRVIRRQDLGCQPCTWFGRVPPCKHKFACKEVTYGEHTRPAN